jgi:hypothetical protein
MAHLGGFRAATRLDRFHRFFIGGCDIDAPKGKRRGIFQL